MLDQAATKLSPPSKSQGVLTNLVDNINAFFWADGHGPTGAACWLCCI